jgi:N-acylglucosamine 2-epimerase (GlcNAc 2-epimerase)
VLLALSSVYALGRDAQVRAEIDALCGYLDSQLRSPHGDFLEGSPASMPRRQNPQMHLFEVMKKRVLGEYFEGDWSRIEPVSVVPGQQAEWVWLLKGFERLTGCPTARLPGELLASSALRYRDEATGCLIDEGDANGNITGACGRRPRSLRRGSRRPRRAPPTRPARRCRAWNGIISAIPGSRTLPRPGARTTASTARPSGSSSEAPSARGRSPASAARRRRDIPFERFLRTNAVFDHLLLYPCRRKHDVP